MSNQEKLKRVRRPARNKLSYETISSDGYLVREELPFVLGIMCDFLGDARSQQSSEQKWHVLDVTVENFGTVLAQSGAGIGLQDLQGCSPSEPHDPQRLKLVNAWRGIYSLVVKKAAAATVPIQIRLIDVSQQELIDELAKPDEDSVLFSKIYDRVFGVAQATPYCAILVALEFSPTDEDRKLLSTLSRIGKKAFCPFVVQAASGEQGEWSALQQEAEAGFLALLAPSLSQIPRQPNTDPILAYAQRWLDRIIELWSTTTIPTYDQHGFIVAPSDQMLACSRFMQYLLVIVRDSVGSFQAAEDFELYLQRWLMG